MHHLRFLSRLLHNLRHRVDRPPTDSTDPPDAHSFPMGLQDRMHLRGTHLTTIVDRIKRGGKRLITDRAFEPFHTFCRFAVLMNPFMFAEGTFHQAFS